MPPLPKPTAQRRRRNVVAGARTLHAIDGRTAPDLPDRGADLEWHPLTVAEWRAVWASPMAPEYTDSDLHGLFVYIDLVDTFWRCPHEKAVTKKELAGEIRLQAQRFGLSPIDRRRLQWEIERGEQAQEAGERRRAAKRPSKAEDPRLRAI